MTALTDTDGIRGFKVLPGVLRLGSVVMQLVSCSTQLSKKFHFLIKSKLLKIISHFMLSNS